MWQILKITWKRFVSTPITVIFLLFGIILSMLMISFNVSFIGELQAASNDKMENAPPNALMFGLEFNSENKVSIKEIVNVLECIDKTTGIILNNILLNIDKAGVDRYSPVSAEWFDGETGWHYPLAQGRYYTPEEIREGAKVVLIGSNYKQYIEKKSNKQFINILGKEYEVIGIIGFKDKKSLWDNRLFMPIPSLPKVWETNELGTNVSFVIYNKNKNCDVEIDKILSNTQKKYDNAIITQVSALGEDKILEQFYANPDTLLQIGILVYVVAIIYSINIVSFWVERRRYEIGVRKAFGHTNFRIATLIFQEMFGISIVACGLGIMIQAVLGLFMNEFIGYNLKLYFLNFIVSGVIVFLTAFLTSIWPVIKSLKVQPSEAMKL